LSPDGRRAVVSLNGNGGPDLWILDLDRGVSTRFTSRHGNNLFPVWSPDGGTILFQSSPTEVFRKETRGVGAEERIHGSTLTEGPLDWSRDGHSVLYFEIAPGIRIVPVSGKQGPRLDRRRPVSTVGSERE
jgi:TolB protein